MAAVGLAAAADRLPPKDELSPAPKVRRTCYQPATATPSWRTAPTSSG